METSCGALFDAFGQLLGLAFPRCRKKCSRDPGHPGLCWCSLHAANTHAVVLPEENGDVPETFATLWTTLRQNSLTKWAPHLRRVGVTSPGKLKAAAVNQLEISGVPEETAIQLICAALVARPQTKVQKKEHSREAIPRRSDHPVIAKDSRGSRLVAVDELATEEGRARWLHVVEKDIYANSAIGPRTATGNRWCFAARVWGVKPLPLTPDVVTKMAAFFKAGGYKSVGQYFSR